MKTDYKIVISENNQNKVLETFISIKFDTECNETIPDIVLYGFHKDYELLTKKNVKQSARGIQNSQIRRKKRQIWNQRPQKHRRPPWPFLSRFVVCHKIDET